MPRMLADRRRSRRLSHLLTGLYRAHLGWLLGHRFLLLMHTGRTSGLKRQTVLEVMRHDRETGMYVVASGWGAKADWLRNVTQTPAVIVQSGRELHDATATRLPPDEAAREIANYAQRHPLGFRGLAWVTMGERLPVTAENCRRLAAVIPIVALRPTR